MMAGFVGRTVVASQTKASWVPCHPVRCLGQWTLAAIGWLALALPLAAQGAGAVKPFDVLGPRPPVELAPGTAVVQPLIPGIPSTVRLVVPDDLGWRLRMQATQERPHLEFLDAAGRLLAEHEPLFGFGWVETVRLDGRLAETHRVVLAGTATEVPVGAIRLELIADAEDPALPLETRAAELLRQDSAEGRAEAVLLLREALSLRQHGDDPPARLRAMLALGAAIRPLDANVAIEQLARAVVASKALPESATHALILDQLGHAQLGIGHLDEALQAFDTAADLWARLGLAAGACRARGSACTVRLRQGAWAPARQCLESTIAKAQELGLQRMATRLSLSLGGVASNLGEPKIAFEATGRALTLAQTLGDRLTEAQARNNLAALHRRLGEPEEALRQYRDALTLFEALGNRRWEARTLNNLGFVYLDLGNPRRARPLLDRALVARRAAGDRAGEAVTLRNLARTALAASPPTLDVAAALAHQALTLSSQLDDRRGQATAHRLLAQIAVRGDTAKDFAVAQRHLDQALALRQALEDPLGIAWLELDRVAIDLTILERAATSTLDDRGLDDTVPGDTVPDPDTPDDTRSTDDTHLDLEPLTTNLTQALATLTAGRDPAGEVTARVLLGRLALVQGRPAEALEPLARAIDQVETLRSHIADPGHRASFLGARREATERILEARFQLHRLEPEAGHDRAAFATSERARARSHLERRPHNASSLEHTDPELHHRWLQRRRAFDAKSQRRAQQVAQGLSAEALAEIDREVETALAALEATLAEIDPRSSEGSGTPTTTAATTESTAASVVKSAAASLEAIQTLLDEDTGLLEITLGDRRSFAFWVTHDGLTLVELPARDHLAPLAEATHQALRRLDLGTGRTDRQASEELSTALLEPLSPLLDRQRLLVVADGPLHGVPFAALPDPRSETGAPLLVRHEIVALPSASALVTAETSEDAPELETQAVEAQTVEAEPPAIPTAEGPRVAILADPVFDHRDPRSPPPSETDETAPLTWSLDGVAAERLPHTGDEASRIAQRLGEEAQFFLGLEAHRDLLLGGALDDFHTLHFATHGVLDPLYPELSGILLSGVDPEGHPREARVRAHDLLGLDLAAELVVLSGCGTALGRPVLGEGFLGLAHGFLQAGVPRVLASLWPVQDRATAELMDRFYQHLAEPGVTPAAALHRAQRSFLEHPEWSDPHFWAAFTLQGDWR